MLVSFSLYLPWFPTQRDDLNRVLKGSKLTFYDTSNQPESSGAVGSSKPDLGLFHKDNANKGSLKDTCDGTQGEYVYTAQMGGVYMFIKVKTSNDGDPFNDPPDGDIPHEY